jgi:carotenoid cleavage dioxygenase
MKNLETQEIPGTAGIGGGAASTQATTGTWFQQAWKPSLEERAYKITEIQGEVPREIHGTLYRNGPSQKILPGSGYESLHLFDGDALVHGFRFDDGEISYRGRFVENESYLVEQEEGRYCQSGVQVRVDDPTDRVFMRSQPNTNVVWHGGKLLALVENSWPFEIDKDDLGPVGETDFGAERLGMSLTAHPKIDGRTGQMIIHGYQPFEPYVQLYVVEPDGRCSLAETVDVPYATMMHDVAITENYVIFLLCPILIDGSGLIDGSRTFQESISWQPERGLKFGVRRREAGSEMRWFEAPSPGFIFHPGNAYEQDGKIFLDACTYEDGGALIDTLSIWRSGKPFEGDWMARPYLYELDLQSGGCSERKLDDRGAEFPRIDDRLIGHRNRWGYAARARGRTSETDDPWTVIVCYDREGGPSSAHDYGVGHFPSEPVFVPRSADAPEDDGFVLNVVYDGPSDRSYLAVLDARNMAGEPLAKAWLEHRVPMGFHGNFAPGVV